MIAIDTVKLIGDGSIRFRHLLTTVIIPSKLRRLVFGLQMVSHLLVVGPTETVDPADRHPVCTAALSPDVFFNRLEILPASALASPPLRTMVRQDDGA